MLTKNGPSPLPFPLTNAQRCIPDGSFQTSTAAAVAAFSEHNDGSMFKQAIEGSPGTCTDFYCGSNMLWRSAASLTQLHHAAYTTVMPAGYSFCTCTGSPMLMHGKEPSSLQDSYGCIAVSHVTMTKP